MRRFATILTALAVLVAVPAIGQQTLDPEQRLENALQMLAADVDRAQFSSPTLFIIGEVVSLAHVDEVERHARNVERPAVAT